MDVRWASVAAVGIVLILLGVWQAVHGDSEAGADDGAQPLLAAATLPPDDDAPAPDPPQEEGADGDDEAPAANEPPADDQNQTSPDPADPAPRPDSGEDDNTTAAPGTNRTAARDHNVTASCSFRHEGAWTPGQGVGVEGSDSSCRFDVEERAWKAIRVTVRTSGVQGREDLEATLFGLRAESEDLLGTGRTTTTISTGTNSWSFQADEDSLGFPYALFELRIGYEGAAAIDVDVSAVLTY